MKNINVCHWKLLGVPSVARVPQAADPCRKTYSAPDYAFFRSNYCNNLI